MSKKIKKYDLGDMQAVYVFNKDETLAELALLPEGTEYKDKNPDERYFGSLLQVKLAGDTYTGCYSPGISMIQSDESLTFKYDRQEVRTEGDETSIYTYFKDERGYEAYNVLSYKVGSRIIKSRAVFRNASRESAMLEYFPSFSLSGISPETEGEGHNSLKLHRLRSVWSMEGRKETLSFEDLQLERSWAGQAVRCERFGATGSYAVNKFFPLMVVEDSSNGIFWGAQLAHNASWQMEAYRRGTAAQIAGGLADREFGHWMKKISPGEEFETPVAILSVYKGGDSEEIYRRLTSSLNEILDNGPESEQSLPVLFNEYCTTWGNPSAENIAEIVKTIQGHGIEYFVIDCGWYKEPGVPWDISMGDYEVSKELFKEGLKKTVQTINDAGMKAGLWFETDNVGPASKIYKKEDMLLKRDGKVLTTTSRRFLDLKQEKVQKYLDERVIGTLKEYGFEYIKLDCNDTVGIGCDGAESLGEGLRQNQNASYAFLRHLKEEIPGIILENCASGGHKLEPLMMSISSMASFSDAHECEEIPVIAANLHRAILPRQSQIWAVIRKEDSAKRIAYTIANTFLGRMCLSGDVWLLSDVQWALIDKGIAFYKKIAPIIKYGKTSFYGTPQTAYRHLTGWQGILREGLSEDRFTRSARTGSEDKSDMNSGHADRECKKAYVVLHGFNDISGKTVSMDIPEGYEIEEIYSEKEEKIDLHNSKLEYTFDDDMKALAVLLKK